MTRAVSVGRARFGTEELWQEAGLVEVTRARRARPSVRRRRPDSAHQGLQLRRTGPRSVRVACRGSQTGMSVGPGIKFDMFVRPDREFVCLSNLAGSLLSIRPGRELVCLSALAESRVAEGLIQSTGTLIANYCMLLLGPGRRRVY